MMGWSSTRRTIYTVRPNSGGEKGEGQIFQLTPSQGGGWTETVIHSFTGGADGGNPVTGPIIDKSGNLFGLIEQGPGEDYNGAVYELKAPSTHGSVWTERVLYSFKGGSDAAQPSGRLLFDHKGNLDGESRYGGAFDGGTVFQITRQRGSWTEAVLYSFCTQSNCADGRQPEGGLIVDGKGNLYGTTINALAGTAEAVPGAARFSNLPRRRKEACGPRRCSTASLAAAVTGIFRGLA
jgi:hypothetical protein